MTYYNSGIELPISGAPDVENLSQELQDIHNSLHILASLVGGSQSVLRDIELDEGSFIVLVEGGHTVTLPSAAGVLDSSRFYIKAVQDGTVVTIKTSDGDLIEGQYTSIQLDYPQCVAIVSNNVGWWII